MGENIVLTQEQVEQNRIRIKKLISFRNSLGLNQKEFANKVGINVTYYCRLENGGTISDKTLRKIASKFDIPLEVMLNDEIVDVSDRELEKHKEKEEKTDVVQKTSFEKNAYAILDEIIEYGGRDNLNYMKDLTTFLLEVQYLLEYKDQFEDLSENEDKVYDKGQKLIDILLGMA